MIYCCKDCPDRYPGCHSECQKYKEQKRKQDEINEKIKKEKAKERMYQDHMGKIHEKYRKKTRYGHGRKYT